MFYNIQGKENISETVKTENKNKLHNQGIDHYFARNRIILLYIYLFVYFIKTNSILFFIKQINEILFYFFSNHYFN